MPRPTTFVALLEESETDPDVAPSSLGSLSAGLNPRTVSYGASLTWSPEQWHGGGLDMGLKHTSGHLPSSKGTGMQGCSWHRPGRHASPSRVMACLVKHHGPEASLTLSRPAWSHPESRPACTPHVTENAHGSQPVSLRAHLHELHGARSNTLKPKAARWPRREPNLAACMRASCGGLARPLLEEQRARNAG